MRTQGICQVGGPELQITSYQSVDLGVWQRYSSRNDVTSANTARSPVSGTDHNAPVASFTVAASRRVYYQASGQWKDGDTLHVAESLQKGMRVIVTGRLGQRDYQADDGTSRTVYELDADDFGPSLKWATAKITKITRDKIPDSAGDTNSQRTAAPSAPGSGFSDEPPF